MPRTEINQSLVNGKLQDIKTDGSYRHVDLSESVVEALKTQYVSTGHKSNFVFCSATGTPLQHRNVTKRVWYPLLKHIGIAERNPYQSRHTTAILWLATGESPPRVDRQATGPHQHSDAVSGVLPLRTKLNQKRLKCF